MAEISIIEVRQGPVGPAGSDANVTAANVLTAVQAMTTAQELSTREAIAVSSAAPTATPANPTTIAFARTKLERKINPIPDEFIVFDTKFETSGGLTVGSGSTLTAGSGLVITKNGVNSSFTNAISNKLLAPCVAVEITVDPSAASGASQFVACGITDRSGAVGSNYICGFWNKVAGNVGLDIIKAGVQTATTGSAFAPTSTFKLLTVIYSNNVAIFADTGFGWTFIHLFREALATPWNMVTGWDSNDFAPVCFGFATSGSFKLSRFRAGYAGHVGLQSLCYAKFEDGTPVLDDQGNYFMHAMANMPYDVGSANSWKHTHGMMFRVDPTTYTATPCAQFFPYRAGEFRLDDGFGNIIYDRSTGRWNWLAQNSSQLGAVNAAILNYYSTQNLLSGCHVLPDFYEVVVPGNKPRWDADAIKIGSTWYVGYSSRTADLVGGTFFPALASGPSLDGTFTLVGSDATQTSAEGVHFTKIGGTYYVLSSNDNGLLVYSMSMVLLDTIVPTGFATGSSPHPHFNLIPLKAGNKTKFVIETFNRTLGMGGGAGTYGDREIYESALFDGGEFGFDSMLPRP
jgi:hypothetical protein